MTNQTQPQIPNPLKENLQKNLRDFREGWSNYILNRYDLLPPHVKEQAKYRAFLCQPCLRSGSCLHCGCKTPAMFFSPKKVDSLGRWKEMLSPAEWEVFKLSDEYKKYE